MDNGVIELGSQIEKSFQPNGVVLDFAMLFVDESEEKVKKQATDGIVELKLLLKSIFEESMYTYKNTSLYIRKEESFNQDKKLFFGKKVDYYFSCKFIMTIDIVFGEFDNLSKVESFIENCLSKPYTSTCNYSCYRSDKKELEDKLKSEIAKKCKDDADIILGAINQKVTSVCKIVYKSSGLLSSNLNTVKCTSFSNDFEASDDSFDDFDSDDSFEKVTANYIVDGIRNSKINLSDSISCVFYVGSL